MRECRTSGSVEGVVSNHHPYSDPPARDWVLTGLYVRSLT